jgi:hypothetical protein
VRQSRQRISVLVTFFEVDARAVGQSSLDTGDQIAAASAQAVVRSLVLQRVVEIEIRALGIQVVGSEPATCSEIAVGDLRVDSKSIRETVGAAGADTSVVLPLLGL